MTPVTDLVYQRVSQVSWRVAPPGTILRENKGKAVSQGPNVAASVPQDWDCFALFPPHCCCVILMRILVNINWDLCLGRKEFVTHVWDQLPPVFPVYISVQWSCCHPPCPRVTPTLPSGHRQLPARPVMAISSHQGGAGQESSGGRGRDWSGVSFLPTSSLSRIQSIEVTQPPQLNLLFVRLWKQMRLLWSWGGYLNVMGIFLH